MATRYTLSRNPHNPDVWDIKPASFMFARLLIWTVTLVGSPLLLIGIAVMGEPHSEPPVVPPTPAAAPVGMRPIAPLPAVLQNPVRYARMPITQAAKLLRATPNRVRNIVVDTPRVHLLLENKDKHTVSYVDVTLKDSGPCSQTRGFDSAPLLAALGVDAQRLTLTRKVAHAHTYMDHTSRVKVTVMCSVDGEPFSVGFSATYYEPL